MDDTAGIVNVLGTLGAYFAVVLVLAIAVETILDTIKLNSWLNSKLKIGSWLSFLDVQRQTISPDQAMRDIAYWVPPKSQAEVKIAALNNLVEQFQPALNQLTADAESGLATTRQLVQLSGLSRQEATIQANIAQKLYILRKEYSAMEANRIARLRRVSALIGIVIAVVLRLDTFAFLAPMLSPSFQTALSVPPIPYAGMILTGIAASMGSSFWHDQLDKMRAIKESARTMQAMAAQPTQ